MTQAHYRVLKKFFINFAVTIAHLKGGGRESSGTWRPAIRGDSCCGKIAILRERYLQVLGLDLKPLDVLLFASPLSSARRLLLFGNRHPRGAELFIAQLN